jgi:hypothetical protein
MDAPGSQLSLLGDLIAETEDRLRRQRSHVDRARGLFADALGSGQVFRALRAGHHWTRRPAAYVVALMAVAALALAVALLAPG